MPPHAHPFHHCKELLDLDLYPFQPVRDENGHYINVMLVKAAFTNAEEEAAYEIYKDDILFIGIMSYETFPFPSPNPYSNKFAHDEYLDKFPGWLNMVGTGIFCVHVYFLRLSGCAHFYLHLLLTTSHNPNFGCAVP